MGRKRDHGKRKAGMIEEWDFPQGLTGQHLTACWIYEYARESRILRAAAAEVKELREKEWRDGHKKKNPKPQLTLKGKRLKYRRWRSNEINAEIQKLLPECNAEERATIDRFYTRVEAYNAEKKRREKLPDFEDAFNAVVHRHGIVSEHYQGTLEFIISQPYFPAIPWSKLESDQQARLVDRRLISQPITPSNLEGFNEIREAVPQCIKEQEPKWPLRGAWAAEWFCRPYVLQGGQEIRPFKIDWSGSSNTEICAGFKEWVSLRRKQLGIEEPKHRQTRRTVAPRGRGKGDADLQSSLYYLEIMRVLHVCQIEKVSKMYSSVASRWIERETEGFASAKNREMYTKHWGLFLQGNPNLNDAKNNYRSTLRDGRRGAAKKTFRDLFPFEKEEPMSWDLAQP